MSEMINILIIEDSEDDLILLLRVLRKAEYKVNYQQVMTAKELIRALDEKEWDIVISDYALPGFNGLEAWSILVESGKDIPFILVSGTIGEEVAVAAMKTGVHDYIMKNNLSRLVPAIKREMNEAENRSTQKRTKKALKTSESLLDSIIKTIPDIVYRIDSNRKILFLSHAIGKYGYDSLELTGESFFKIVHPDDREFIEVFFQNIVMDANSPNFTEIRLLTGSGETRVFNLYSKAIEKESTNQKDHNDHEKKENLFQIQGIASDITEAKEAEKKRKLLEEQLWQAQKMESIGRLAGGIAHDFNNILTIIIGNAELGLAQIPEDNNLRECIGDIKESAGKASQLTKQLLAFSRRQILDPRVINLNEMLKSMNKMIRRLIGEDLELKMMFSEDLWPVFIDSVQMEQVITNLMVNARDAMPGGGSITIETKNIRNENIGNSPEDVPGDYVLIAMEDTGTGMDEETLKKIFDPFFTTKEPGKGTGLGLSTCFGIIKQNGGYIRASSEVKKGTVFEIYLPRSRRKKADAQTPVKPDVIRKGNETIFLVEDEPSVRKMVSKMLKKEGYTIIEASNGKEALSVIKEKNGAKIDLLITDMIMPHMNGKELHNLIRKIFPEIKVLFMSGYTNDSIAQHGVLETGLNFLQKPFTLNSITKKVRQVLDKPVK